MRGETSPGIGGFGGGAGAVHGDIGDAVRAVKSGATVAMQRRR